MGEDDLDYEPVLGGGMQGLTAAPLFLGGWGPKGKSRRN